MKYSKQNGALRISECSLKHSESIISPLKTIVKMYLCTNVSWTLILKEALGFNLNTLNINFKINKNSKVTFEWSFLCTEATLEYKPTLTENTLEFVFWHCKWWQMASGPCWPLCGCVVTSHRCVHTHNTPHTSLLPALTPVIPWTLCPFSPHPAPQAPGQGASFEVFLVWIPWGFKIHTMQFST